MQIYSGIDEAGLGPILGPFCATVTTFSSPSPLKELLKDIKKDIFYVDDSKKVYQGKYGFNRLEENVLAFFYLFSGVIPQDINSFIPSLNSPWNNNTTTLPIGTTKNNIITKAKLIREVFVERNIDIINIKRTAISPINFNKLIDLWSNKSIVCQQIINPLLKAALNLKGNHTITVDKQGGRKFYKSYLEELLPGSDIKIVLEENNYSHYSTNNCNIHFKAKADSSDFPVALSSMFSKYMRELAMLSFNKYWSDLAPGIKKTAGYYTDGVRFINQLGEKNLLPSNLDILIRKK